MMLAERLKKHVYKLSHEIGDRNIFKYDKLNEAAGYITGELASFGYKLEFQEYSARNRMFRNIIAVKEGAKKPDEIIVLGAHYDTRKNPGADDNASGVAGLLEAARIFSDKAPQRTIKFVAFTNEERPFFKRKTMGSRVYTKAAKERNEKIKGALILEMIGYYSNKPKSQYHPPGFNFFYPNKGNFIGIVGNTGSKGLLKKTVASFRRKSKFPIEWIIAPGIVVGVDFSDNWSFWKEGYPALMITDTSFYRNPHYHKASDTYDTLDYGRMSDVVMGIAASLKALTN
jgi:Zn-dependent M28 family amino/carboxypeptidase